MKYLFLILGILVLGAVIYVYKKPADSTLEQLRSKSYLDPQTYTLDPAGTPPAKIMDRDSALGYIMAWKKFANVRDDDSSYKMIDTPDHIRADVGAIEFQYDTANPVLIVRALVDKQMNESNPKFAKALIVNLQEAEQKKEGLMASFGDAYLEDDTTAGELNSDFPERLNIRLDIKDASLSKDKAVSIFDALSSLAYVFKQGDYENILTQTNAEVFPDPKQ